MKAHDLDQLADLRLRITQPQRPTLGAQAARQYGQVEHQRGVGKGQPAEVDDDIRLGTDRARQGLAATSLGAPVLVATAAQGRRLFIEVDDCGKLPKAGDT